MSSAPLESLPADLERLLALEGEAYPTDLALKAEVLSRVELAIQLGGPGGSQGGGPAPGGGGAAHAAGATAATKLLAAVGLSAFVAGAGAGAVVDRLARPVPSVVSLAPVPGPATSVESAAPHAPASTSAAPSPSALGAETASALPVAPHPSHAPVEAPSTHGDLSKEREVLDVARAALARSRPDDAIAACELHAKTWPHGYLVEEREVVFIQALVAAGRRAEAERQAAEFRKMFRQSMLLPAVDVALDAGL